MPFNSVSLSKETKKILKDNDIYLSKKLGQNYLIDDFKRKKIIEFANLSNDDVVLEVGSGIGTLTLELAKKSKKVIAIEQDLNIFKILKERLKKENISNVDLIYGDALKVDFPRFNKIVSNLPYQISSPITFKFLKYNFDLAILMYQKEFASRMLSRVGEKNYSRLSAMLYFKGSVEFLDDVSAESFIPKPKITSSVIKLKPKLMKKKIAKSLDYEYSIFCKALFQHKNKKIRNALIDSRHILGYDDKKKIRNFLDNDDKVSNILNKRVIQSNPDEILSLATDLKYIIRSNKE